MHFGVGFFLLRKEDPTRQRVTGFPNHLACRTRVALIKSTKSLDIQSVYHSKHQLMDLHKHIEFSLCLIKNILPTFRRWKSCDLKMVVRVCTMSKCKHGQNIQTNQIFVSLSIETFEHLYFSISHRHTWHDYVTSFPKVTKPFKMLPNIFQDIRLHCMNDYEVDFCFQ
jgi:hypothetical protein